MRKFLRIAVLSVAVVVMGAVAMGQWPATHGNRARITLRTLDDAAWHIESLEKRVAALEQTVEGLKVQMAVRQGPSTPQQQQQRAQRQQPRIGQAEVQRKVRHLRRQMAIEVQRIQRIRGATIAPRGSEAQANLKPGEVSFESRIDQQRELLSAENRRDEIRAEIDQLRAMLR